MSLLVTTPCLRMPCVCPAPLRTLITLRAFNTRFAHFRSPLRPQQPSTVLVRATAPGPNAASLPSSFPDLGLSAELLKSVEEKGFETPTEIQAAAIPALLRNRSSDFLLASHTGSGKTLAYLLPIVQVLKEHEAVYGLASKPKRPRALVLGPTRELAEQIYGVAKSVARSAPYRAVLATGGGDMRTQRSSLEARPLDVLVGTPARVTQHAQRGSLYYGDVEIVVLDEADTMLDRGFGPEVSEILKAVRNKPNPARCVLVSATMTRQVKRLVDEMFAGIKTIETSTLHRGVAGARHAFLPVPSGQDKLDLATQVVSGEAARGKRVMVFCNTLDSCRAAEHRLRESGLPTVCYHGDVPLEGRRDAIAAFSDPEATNPPLLIATDLAARGLDIPGRVDHIVNFDFPLNPIDYLHRTGRTARAGASGRVTSLVSKADRVLSSRIEDALSRGLPLDGLSASKAVLPPHMKPKPDTLKRRAEEAKAAKHTGHRGQRVSRSSSSKVGSGAGAPSPSSFASRGGGGGGGGAAGKGRKQDGPGRRGQGKSKTFTKFK